MIFLVLFLATSLFAQEGAPLWIQEGWRSAQYPPSQWYTGFSQDILKPGMKAAEPLKRLERDAQKKMAESVIVRIASESALETKSNIKQQGQSTSETIDKNYMQAIQASTDIEIAKAEIRSHHDAKVGIIYAFAAVKKKDLADFYRSKITSIFYFADKELALAEQIAEQGKKKPALDKVYAVEDSLKSVGYWDSFLQAVESDNSHIVKEKDFWQRASAMKIRFQNATSVYLDISGDNALDELGAEMREKNCNCVIAREEGNADYIVAIKTKLSRCNITSHGDAFCWANAIASVSSQKSKNILNIKIPEAKGGWANKDKGRAEEKAFKLLTKNLAEKINQTINQ
ncbi:MAG: hypothetical protein LBH25_00820 [Fibromonadaceae bacterium]|jgi:hypothetical protein|nr:hypothetical protein [Fibromonadaceae bacterium]